MHKGVSAFGARMVLNKQRNLIRQLDADIVFLQEVRGSHKRHSKLTLNSQYEYLADSIWSDCAYGKNALVSGGHHGNAILSRYPIISWENVNVSAHPSEQRGLLHCEIAIPGWSKNLHCICVHFGLFASWRRHQFNSLINRINLILPNDTPLIVAGDFNDWQQEAANILVQQQHLFEVFKTMYGAHARSFPSILPFLPLDRIYVRGFTVVNCQLHKSFDFANLSDHIALTADLLHL